VGLHRITVFFETSDARELEAVQEAIKVAICPVPDHEAHRCRNRWMMMSSEIDEQELRELAI
jgi:hypothetical protein